MKTKLLVAFFNESESGFLPDNFFIQEGLVYEGFGPRQVAHEPQQITDETMSELEGIFDNMDSYRAHRDRLSAVILPDCLTAIFMEVEI